MEQFSLDKWLQDKSRKVVTRSGNPVRILCNDCGVMMSHPILTEIVCSGNAKVLEYHYIDGTTQNKNNDLFFADEEEESQSIEIPFGAKDSEFIKDEYYIPEGCEARIEGNKVIIEKKEEELTEFERKLKEVLYEHATTNTSSEEKARQYASELLDLARKEIEKDLPKWKKTVQDYYHQGNIPCTNPTISGDEEYLIVGTYEIKISDLETLPKEE